MVLAMGNSVGNLDEYWSVFRETKGVQGGFIWFFAHSQLRVETQLTHTYRDFVDQGLCQLTDGSMPTGNSTSSKVYWSFGGHWGEQSHGKMPQFAGQFIDAAAVMQIVSFVSMGSSSQIELHIQVC